MTDSDQVLAICIAIATGLAIFGAAVWLAALLFRIIAHKFGQTLGYRRSLAVGAVLIVITLSIIILWNSLSKNSDDSMSMPDISPDRSRPFSPSSGHQYMPAGFVISRDGNLQEAFGRFAAVLLTAPGPRGVVLCRSFLLQLELDGFRPLETIDGVTVYIRPVYWFTKHYHPARQISSGELPKDLCGKLIADYDFERAKLIMDRLSLSGPGPFLVAADLPRGQYKGSRFATWDLGDVPVDEMDDSYESFLNGYRDRVESDVAVKANFRQHIKNSILTYSPDVSHLFGVEAKADSAP